MKLHADFAVSTRGCVDLSLLARSVDNAHWKGKYTNAIALSRLVEAYTQRTLPKPSKVRTSNWQAASLTPQQQRCAFSNGSADSGITFMGFLQTRRTTPTRASPFTTTFPSC